MTDEQIQNERSTTKQNHISDRELQMKRGQCLKAAEKRSCNYRYLDIITETHFPHAHVQKHDKILLKRLFSETLQCKELMFVSFCHKNAKQT